VQPRREAAVRRLTGRGLVAVHEAAPEEHLIQMPPAAQCSKLLDRSVDGIAHPGDSQAPFLQLREPLLLENKPLGRLFDSQAAALI
jgi:hypothetical protein